MSSGSSAGERDGGAVEKLARPRPPPRAETPVAKLPAAPPAPAKGPRGPRFRPPASVELPIGDREELAARMRDIGKGGLFVPANEPPELGTEIKVQIRSPEGELVLTARVVHTLKPGGPAPAGFGLAFTELTPLQRQTLDQYLEGETEELSDSGVKDGPDFDVEMLREFLTMVEAQDLYGALGAKPDASLTELKLRISRLRELFRARPAGIKAATVARLEVAERLLDKVAQRFESAERRALYDKSRAGAGAAGVVEAPAAVEDELVDTADLKAALLEAKEKQEEERSAKRLRRRLFSRRTALLALLLCTSVALMTIMRQHGMRVGAYAAVFPLLSAQKIQSHFVGTIDLDGWRSLGEAEQRKAIADLQTVLTNRHELMGARIVDESGHLVGWVSAAGKLEIAASRSHKPGAP